MKEVILIGGPTASGKSHIATQLAYVLNNYTSIEIINADSIQVYDELKILSSQPSGDDMSVCKHNLYGFFPSKKSCSVWLWKEYAENSIKSAWSKNHLPVLVGGTGLYFKALINGLSEIPDINENIRSEGRAKLARQGVSRLYDELYKEDPSLVSSLNNNDSQRVLRAWEVFFSSGKSINYWQKKQNSSVLDGNWHGFSVLPDREQLYNRINLRFINMIKNGAIEEVKEFLTKNLDNSLPCSKAIGIKELSDYLDNISSLDQSIDLAQQSTRRLAKRQYTWFRNQMTDFIILDGEIDSNINKMFNIIRRFY